MFFIWSISSGISLGMLYLKIRLLLINFRFRIGGKNHAVYLFISKRVFNMWEANILYIGLTYAMPIYLERQGDPCSSVPRSYLQCNYK